MEYFKNVMLKLYETGEAESLLPVVGQVGVGQRGKDESWEQGMTAANPSGGMQ